MKTVAIIVLFNDDSNSVKANIEKIAKQVDLIYLIDNSSISYLNKFSRIENAIYLPQYKNLGIAAAQNIGIKKAIENIADFIFFADPDSEIPENTVEELIKKYNIIKKAFSYTGGICTSAINETTGYSISLKGNFIKDIKEWNVTEVTYMMNSGSLIPTALFKQVGLMCEELFIDDVDCEWCWRASKKKGLHFFQDNDIIIEHHLGNNSRKVGNKRRSLAPPMRLFYQFRNYIWLLRMGYAPKQWLKYNGWKYFIKFFYFPIFVHPRLKNFKNIAKGIFNGIFKMPRNTILDK